MTDMPGPRRCFSTVPSRCLGRAVNGIKRGKCCVRVFARTCSGGEGRVLVGMKKVATFFFFFSLTDVIRPLWWGVVCGRRQARSAPPE